MARGGARLTLLALLLLGSLFLKAGCSRKADPGSPRAGRLTPTKGHAYTPLPRPPTPTFVPGLPTPPPDLPG